jgi:hypothetical protein
MNRKKDLLTTGFQLLIGAVLLVLIFQLLPQIHPLPQTKFVISRDEAIRLAADYLEGEIPENELKSIANFVIEEEYLKKKKVTDDMAQLLNYQPYKYWEIELFSGERESMDLTLSSDEDDVSRSLSDEGYTGRVSPEGIILELYFKEPRLKIFEQSIEDSSYQINNYDNDEEMIRRNMLGFLRTLKTDTSKLLLQKKETQEDSLGTIFNYTFSESINRELAILHEVSFTFNGIFLNYEKKVESELLDNSEGNSKVLRIVYSVIEIIIYLLLIILILYYLIYFSRKESISFKISLPITFLIGLITLSKSLFTLWNAPIPFLLVGTLPASIFYTLGMFLLYTASDAMARLQWNDKLVVLDRFRQGRILTYSTGKTIRNGIFLGILGMGIYIILMYFYVSIFKGTLHSENELKYNFSILFPVATILLASLNKSIFSEIFFRLFGISVIARWFKRNLVIILGAIIFTFTFYPEIIPYNIFARYAILVIPSFLFVYFFVKYEIITTIFGLLTFLLLEKGVAFYATDESFIQQAGFSILFVGVIFLLFALSLVLFKQEDKEEPVKYVPDYIKKMEEKERLIRELEIARNVQEKFLPLETPILDNYQISAFCQPAWEVGGDYYDYFRLDESRLGITIGDVSNKGVSAAFYMTMVKGFLKSLALHSESPREILSQANALFYENVERGHFISMIFGILDAEKNEFIFARAGHNPLLLMFGESRTGQWLVPQGVAIGLTTDQNFRSAIKEEKISIKSGDVLILYTDGYSESMNEKSEEFGEEKLEALIQNNTQLSSREIIELLEKKIKEWEGNRPASDDRTIVVIKRIG